MKQINVWFCDMGGNFNPKRNIFLDILKKHYQVNICENNPTFLIYSCYGFSSRKFTNCIKIFYTIESVRPDFNECDYAIGLDYITFEDRYHRLSRLVKKEQFASTEKLLKRKFCNFIYSNSSNGEGAKIRKEFCMNLMEYRHIDCPGIVLNNMQNAIEPRSGNWVNGKLKFLRNYKFTISFENNSAPGYVTEKLLHPFQVNSIPIYWGDPYVTREFNPKSFINCHDFANFNEVIEHIKYLDTHDTAYLSMVYEPPMLPDYHQNEQSLEDFLLKIIERGMCPLPKDQYGKFSLVSQVNSAMENIESVFISYINKSNHSTFYDIWNKIKWNMGYGSGKEIYKGLSYLLATSPQSNIYKFCEDIQKNINTDIDVGDSKLSTETIKQRVSVLISAISVISGRKVIVCNDFSRKDEYKSLLSLLQPMDIVGYSKVRIGPNNVGGYVMLDPDEVGSLYSFGVHWHSLFDLSLANRGFMVYEYDGEFKIPPTNHHNIVFSATNPFNKLEDANEVTLEKVFIKCSKYNVLQVNLRVDETLRFFSNISERILLRFKQIVATFRLDKYETLISFIPVFKKILKSHQCIHFHYHNGVGDILYFGDFLFAGGIELTFIRRDNHQFIPSTDEYPTPLDSPTIAQYPDIYIGRFDVITLDLNSTEHDTNVTEEATNECKDS